MKKILIFGGTGGLGSKLIEYLPNFKITALGSKDVDVTDFTAVNNFFKDYNKPEIVINLSGYNYNSSLLSANPVFGTAVYSGCKAYIDNLIKTVTVENLSKGITCNSLQLGYMDGGLTYEVPEPFITKVKESIPLKRWGTIEEIANAVKYFINTEYTSGHALKINGGMNL